MEQNGSHHVKEHEKLCQKMVLKVVCIAVKGHLCLLKVVQSKFFVETTMGRIQGQFSWRITAHACIKVGLKAWRFKGQCKIRHQLLTNIKLQEVLN